MKTISWLAAAWLACALAADGRADVVLYPAPGGLAASPRFAVQVNVGGVWSNSYVNFNPVRAPVAGTGAENQKGKSFSWTTFEISDATQVRVRRLTGVFASCVVRPSRFGIAPVGINSNTVEFTIQPGQKVSVEFDTDIVPKYYNATYGIPSVTNLLMVFADPIRAVSATNGIPASDILIVTPGSNQTNIVVSGATPPVAGKCTLDTTGKTVVVFPPGVHDIGYWQVPNNVVQVHLCGGAVVYGALDVIPQGRAPFYDLNTVSNVYTKFWQESLRSTFKLTGPGILSGEKLPWHLRKDFVYDSTDLYWALVKQLQLAVTTCTLEDVTLACPPYWCISYMNDGDSRSKGTFDNFKIVGGWCYNNDGIPNPTGAGSAIRNAFLHVDDDAFKLYNSGSSISNCVVWVADNGSAFQWGWYGKTASGVAVDDVDVIHFENWWGDNSPKNRSVFNYADGGGSGTISDTSLRNVTVEGKILRLMGFASAGGQVMRGISCKNLTCDGMGAGYVTTPPGGNYFSGSFTNWAFTNFVFGGTGIVSMALASNTARFACSGGAGAGFTFGSGTPPNIANNGGATGITASSACLSGMLLTTGGAATAVTLCWGTNDAGAATNGWAHVVPLGPRNPGALSTNVTGLAPRTIHYYRLLATNAFGSAWSRPAAAFTTPGSPPVIDNGAGATNLTPTSARLLGTLVTGGPADVAVLWGTADGGATANWQHTNGLGILASGPLYCDLTGLATRATYYYRYGATNAVGAAIAPATASFATPANATSNGLPFSWLATYGITNTNDTVEAEDPDSDGANNLGEYVAGTSPSNPTNYFQIRVGLDSGAALVSVQTVPAEGSNYTGKTRYYDLEASTSLWPAADWQPVPGFTNLSGMGQVIRLTNDPGLPVDFFRGRARLFP